MAFGSKLGKVFGAMGSGLSFIPGPWSAVGVALSAAGQVASKVGEKKDANKLEEEQTQAQSQPAAAADPSRPEQAQLQTAPETQLQEPMTNMFGQRQQKVGGYQSQMGQEIANMLVREDGDFYQ
jgi:hypothetical protein